jgi:hypothetical protein
MNRVNVAPCPSGAVTTVSLGRFESDQSHHAGYRECVDAILPRRCMSSEHFGQLARQFKRVSGSSGLKVQAAIAC